MRIAVPVIGDEVGGALQKCGAVRFYEDDHGRVTRQFTVPVEAGDTVRAVIERHGVDVMLCGALQEEEKRELAASGILLSTGASGGADGAVRAYLNAAVVCDPNNHCNYCAHKEQCALPRTEE